MENKQQLWSKILNILITILTAVATSFGVSSCIGVLKNNPNLENEYQIKGSQVVR